MVPIEGVLRRQGSPDIYIHIRQEYAETFIANGPILTRSVVGRAVSTTDCAVRRGCDRFSWHCRGLYQPQTATPCGSQG